jgi:hypothetical protein
MVEGGLPSSAATAGQAADRGSPRLSGDLVNSTIDDGANEHNVVVFTLTLPSLLVAEPGLTAKIFIDTTLLDPGSALMVP